MIFMGLDPGTHGAMAVIDYAEQPEPGMYLYRFHQCTYQEVALAVRLHFYATTYAVLEKVRSSPQMGRASAFTFGQGYGTLIGILTACRIVYQEYTPQQWLKGLGIRQRTKQETTSAWKGYLASVASSLFPDYEIHKEAADAVLMAEFARRTWWGRK